MRRKTCHYEKKFRLDGRSIDAVSVDLEAELTNIDVESLNRIRIRLLIEEALLRMRDRFGEEATFIARIYYRFSRPVIEIEKEGEVFNPLGKIQNDMADWSGSLLTSVGMMPQYSYEKEKNYLRLTLWGKRMNPVLKMIIALAIGIICGLIGANFLSESTQLLINDMLLTPLFDLWYRVLLAMSGPVIFLMVITTMLNNRSMAEQSCVQNLGIDKYYASVTLPQGIVLYMPVNVIGTLALTVYAASRFEILVTPIWFAVAMILAVILFVATPPVPGANLLAYIAIFAQLGIASQTLIDAMVFDIVFGIFASAANLVILQLELINQADTLGLLDIDRLRKAPN